MRQRSYPRRWRWKSGAKSIYHTSKVNSDEKEDKENDIGTVRFLADDHSGASDVDTDIVWTVDNEMIISTIIGLFMNVLMVDNATGQNLTRAIMLSKKLEKIKEEKVKEDQNIIIGVHDDE